MFIIKLLFAKASRQSHLSAKMQFPRGRYEEADFRVSRVN